MGEHGIRTVNWNELDLVDHWRRFLDDVRDILDSRDGMITQLYVITRLLRRIDQGDAIDLAVPLHRHARHLLG
jgi:hypothetical protein